MHRFPSGGCLLFLLVALTGCGQPEYVPVTGKVTLAGKPLSSGTVTFVCVSGGKLGYGQIQADGSYEAFTGKQIGLKPGEYKVTVVATEQDQYDSNKADSIPKLLTPQQYSDVETSGLKCVVPNAKHFFAIDL